MQLDPSESINNMGQLRVDVIGAENLPAADSNGKSDPYCKFELAGQEVFKTKTQKKTLNPQWNEFFEVAIPSRTAAKFCLKVYDYDFADKPDFLGGADIKLDELEPFQAKEVKLPLDGKSGAVKLRLLFKPDYVTRSRQGTSTFAGTFNVPGRIVTGVAGAPIKGVTAIGHGVGKGASFLKRGFTGKKGDENGSPTASSSNIPIITTNGSGPPGPGLKRSTGLSLADADTPPDTPPGPAMNNNSSQLGHERTRSISGASIHSTLAGGAARGTATFTVISASGFPANSDLYVAVKQLTPKERTVGKTKHYKSPQGSARFDETFKLQCTPDAQFQIQVRSEHKLRTDDNLGDALYFVDESADPQEKEIKVGEGTVVIKSSFTPAPAPEPPRPSTAGSSLNLSPDTPRSTLRRSFLSKREGRGSREATPNA